MSKKVVTEGGGQNLYKIEGTDKKEVYKVNVGLIFDEKVKIGTARSTDDALSLIKSHSGKNIKEIK